MSTLSLFAFLLSANFLGGVFCCSSPPPKKPPQMRVHSDAVVNESCQPAKITHLAQDIISIVDNLVLGNLLYLTVEDPGLNKHCWLNADKIEWRTTLLDDEPATERIGISVIGNHIPVSCTQILDPNLNKTEFHVYVVEEFRFKAVLRYYWKSSTVAVVDAWDYKFVEGSPKQRSPPRKRDINQAIVEGFAATFKLSSCRADWNVDSNAILVE